MVLEGGAGAPCIDLRFYRDPVYTCICLALLRPLPGFSSIAVVNRYRSSIMGTYNNTTHMIVAYLCIGKRVF